MRLRRRPVTRPVLDRELERLRLSLIAEMRGDLDRQLLEHKRYVDAELDDFNERLNGVMRRALIALNPPKGNQA